MTSMEIPTFEDVKEEAQISRKYTGRLISESVHVLINKREEEDNTDCSHGEYCNVWGNTWVAVATPVLILIIICVITGFTMKVFL